MSDLRDLLEKMDAMAAVERKPTGPKWPGYLKGTDSAKKIRSRMVGDGGASGISGEPGAAEDKAQKDEVRAYKQQIKDQITGLVAQLQAARSQLAALNQQFPQGASPVEKAMTMQQINSQKISVKQQIEDLSAQIAAMRQQAI